MPLSSISSTEEEEIETCIGAAGGHATAATGEVLGKRSKTSFLRFRFNKRKSTTTKAANESKKKRSEIYGAEAALAKQNGKVPKIVGSSKKGQYDSSVTNRGQAVAGSASSSWLSRSKYFQSLCDKVFDMVDVDNSGTVDEKELYGGLLLIHLKLGSFAGPAACRPLDRQQCHQVFELMDADNSGSLDKQEFKQVMMVLFSNVLLRVLALWSMTIMILPMIAAKILDGVYCVYFGTWNIITNLDEHMYIADQIELTIESIIDFVVTKCVPNPIMTFVRTIQHYMSMVPASVWKTVPLTLVTTILSTVVIPWLLYKIDVFFHSLASSKSEQEQQQQQQQQKVQRKQKQKQRVQ